MNYEAPILEEVEIPRDCHVYFQDPVDLKIQNDNNQSDMKVVLHDDEDPTDSTSSDIPVSTPDENPPIEANSPIEAISKLRMDPRNVMIAKYGDNYYVDHNDLKCYMDACKETKYENALNNIIKVHEDDDISASNIRVIMTKSDYSVMSESTKNKINESSVSFDIYG